jgi:hypothetical protein
VRGLEGSHPGHQHFSSSAERGRFRLRDAISEHFASQNNNTTKICIKFTVLSSKSGLGIFIVFFVAFRVFVLLSSPNHPII